MTRFSRRTYAGRHWHHPSVHALMDEVGGDRDPLEVVLERARELVADARAIGWSGPPFDPVVLAGLQTIRARPSDAPMDSDALIRALADGSLEIVWNDSSAVTRRNFSICHELGHTLFPDAYEVVRHRSARRRDLEDELERLCDAAAAEMLMPAEEFAQDLVGCDLTGDTVVALARRYVASPEAAARRIATLSERPCASVLLTMRLKPTEARRASQTGFDFGDGVDAPAPRLRVDYMVPSRSFTDRFPPHKSIPEGSCAYSALNGSGCGTEAWSTGQATVNLHVNALAIPSDPEGRPRVLALVTPA